MTIRMHPVSASRWAELAATRHPIDLTGEPSSTPPPGRRQRRRRRREEHAAIQAQVDSIGSPRVPAIR
jgi:hypothetical protein